MRKGVLILSILAVLLVLTACRRQGRLFQRRGSPTPAATSVTVSTTPSTNVENPTPAPGAAATVAANAPGTGPSAANTPARLGSAPPSTTGSAPAKATATAAPAPTQPPAAKPTSPPQVSTGAPTPTSGGSTTATIQTLVSSGGGRVSWSKQNVIAFSQINLSANQDRSEIAMIDPNGSGEKCLTCGQSAIPHASNDIPVWSPDGKYIVFESASPSLMSQSKRLSQSVLNSITQGGSGIDNNLWAMNASGTAYYQLTNVSAAEGVLHPVFSKDGKQLMWAAHVRVSGSAQAASSLIASAAPAAADATPPAGGRALLLRRLILRRAILRREGLLNNQGQSQTQAQNQVSAQAIQARAQPAKPTFEWMLKVADFSVGPNGPQLTNIRNYQPLGPTYFYESHDFFPDNNTVLFSASPPGPFNLDIYRMDLSTGQAINLTDSPNVWDEHSHISSDGKKIVWISSQGYPYTPTQNYGKTLMTDLWEMNPDGSDKQQITFFNTPGNPEDTGARVILADNSWDPTNDAVVVTRLSYPKRGAPSVSDIVVHFSSPQ